MSYIVRTNVIH